MNYYERQIYGKKKEIQNYKMITIKRRIYFQHFLSLTYKNIKDNSK